MGHTRGDAPRRLPERGKRCHRRCGAVVRTLLIAATALGILPATSWATAVRSGTSVSGDNPPALWLEFHTPTETEVRFAADHYRVAVLNPWETATLHELKTLNPSMIVLAYKDLMSARDYAGAYDASTGLDASILPAGVGYAEALANPIWFLTDANGSRVEWAPYPNHWQMRVWNPEYQDQWVENVKREIVGSEWDGVLADNATPTLTYYLPPGTTVPSDTDANLRAGIRALVRKAADAFASSGKLFVPNVSDGRITPNWWADLTIGGGGFEEQFMHWGTSSTSGYVGDWQTGGWSAQAAEMSGPGLYLAHTTSTDPASSLYGYASFLIAGGGRGAFAATGPSYSGTPLLPEQQWNPGEPIVAAERTGVSWTRSFTHVFAAVNPSDATFAVLNVPSGLVDAGDRPVASPIRLGPHSGVVYRFAASQPSSVPNAASIGGGEATAGPSGASVSGPAPSPAASAAPHGTDAAASSQSAGAQTSHASPPLVQAPTDIPPIPVVSQGAFPTSSRSPVRLCTVPRLVGKTRARALALIRKAGCSVGRTDRVIACAHYGRVVRQAPAPTAQRPVGTRVRIGVSAMRKSVSRRHRSAAGCPASA